MTPLDCAAGIAGGLYLLATLRFRLWKWPVGVLHCVVFAALFWFFRLYAVEVDPNHPNAWRFETIGTVFGLVCVILTIQRNIWSWPTGIVNIVLFFFMYLLAGLYADVLNMVVMFGLSVYGWHQWLRGRRDDGPLVVGTAPARLRLASLAVIALGSPALGFGLSHLPRVSFPYWDSFIFVASLVAQWGLARKYVENWVLWIAVDLVAIPVYAAKDLRAAAVLYFVFLILATCGLIGWVRALRAKAPAAA